MPTYQTETKSKLTSNMNLTETKLKQKIYKILDKDFPGHWRRKISSQFSAGALDLVIIRGKSIWLELKILPRLLTSLQKKEIEKIQAAGGNAYCLTAKQDGSTFYLWDLKEILEFTNLETLLKEALLPKIDSHQVDRYTNMLLSQMVDYTGKEK